MITTKKTLMKMINKHFSPLRVLPLLLLFLLLLGYPYHSKADVGDTGPNGGTIISETTTVETTNTATENIGGGIEETTETQLHTTTTVEEVQTETTTQTTTGNYLTNPGFESNTNTTQPTGWNTTGSVNVGDTCGPAGGNCLQTGNESTGGGSVNQTVNLFDKMTQDQINKGFDLTYGGQVFSHGSNSSVPSCSTNSGDCRDSFSITMTITDKAGAQLEKWTHEFNEITWTGWKSYSFDQTIQQNNWTSALANLELWGVDAGYFSGNYGPAFDNWEIKATYDVVSLITSQITTIVQQSIDVVTQEYVGDPVADIINDTATPDAGFDMAIPDVEPIGDMGGPETTVETFTVEVADTGGGGMIESFEITVETNSIGEVVDIQVDGLDMGGGGDMGEMAQPVDLAEVSAEIEATVETPDAQGEPAGPQETTSNEPEPEPTTETANNEPEPEQQETASNEPESKQESESESKSEESESKQETASKEETKEEQREQAKARVATQIVTAIVEKLGQDAASQTTQLALMNMIGASVTKNQPNLDDAALWYQSKDLYDGKQLKDPYSKMINGAQDLIHSQMVDMQYNR